MENAGYRKQLLILTILFFLLIIGKLVQLQIISGKRYFRLAEANRIRKIYTPAPRGRIFSQDSIILADSRPSFAISVIPLEADSQTLINISNFAQIDYPGIKQWFDNIAYLRTPIKVKRNMAHKLVIPKKVQKDLNRIDGRYQLRVRAALVALAGNPYLGKKLEGEYKNQRSYEVRPYRIIYEIKKYELIVLIIRIGHRQGVY